MVTVIRRHSILARYVVFRPTAIHILRSFLE